MLNRIQNATRDVDDVNQNNIIISEYLNARKCDIQLIFSYSILTLYLRLSVQGAIRASFDFNQRQTFARRMKYETKFNFIHPIKSSRAEGNGV